MPEALIRPPAAMYCPIPPLRTGVATYALRVLRLTGDLIDWTVLHPPGGDPACLPHGIRALPLDSPEGDRFAARIFMAGNSPECTGVVLKLAESGGCAVMHETVLHHMLRHHFETTGDRAGYTRELLFERGPSAGRIARMLDRPGPPAGRDAAMKSIPLTGRILHLAEPVACLNPAAAGVLSARLPGRRIFVVGHPLDPLPPLGEPVLPGSPMVGMIGGCHPGRNTEVFLEGMRMARMEMPALKALLVGEGWPASLPGWAASTGRLDDEAYQRAIRTLGIVVDIRHPSCGETSGSLLEAMRAGRPCITSAEGSFLHIPSDAVVRIPVPPDPRALSRAILAIAGGHLPVAALSAAAARHSASESSPDRARREWPAIVRACLETPRQSPPETSRALSAAFHDPPRGFRRVAGPGPVAWAFEGTAVMEARGASALLTAWGEGRVNGRPLPVSPEVLELDGRLLFEGRGRLTQVLWTS